MWKLVLVLPLSLLAAPAAAEDFGVPVDPQVEAYTRRVATKHGLSTDTGLDLGRLGGVRPMPDIVQGRIEGMITTQKYTCSGRAQAWVVGASAPAAAAQGLIAQAIDRGWTTTPQLFGPNISLYLLARRGEPSHYLALSPLPEGLHVLICAVGSGARPRAPVSRKCLHHVLRVFQAQTISDFGQVREARAGLGVCQRS